ncbi:hypothetical protein D3C71_1718290 [compost metagenome]
MGFAWIGSLIVFSWAFFTLGRKYQDFQDIMLARRVARLVEQRKQVKETLNLEDEIPEAYTGQGLRGLEKARGKVK